jgi:hypothetical protein
MTLAISEYYFRLAIADLDDHEIPFDQLRGPAQLPRFCTVNQRTLGASYAHSLLNNRRF